VTTDPFDIARAEEMIRGYSARWYDEPLDYLAVEVEAEGPLVNPETGAASRTFALGGKLDGLVRDRRTDRVLVLERKTSGEDISDGSMYWRRLLLNAQISTYLTLARTLGHDPTGILYDVLGKPGIRPSSVPIVEDGAKVVLDANGARVRTKDGKKWRETTDASQGYVLQTRPETVDEFRERLRAVICEKPDELFRRGYPVRLEAEEREAAFDAWQTAAAIREGRNANRFPRNPDACIRYGSTCTFFGVCTGETSLEDPLRYRRVENVHEELAARATRLPLLTNSEIGTHRACARLHHYRYDLGYRALEDSDNQRFGSLVHAGLEAWTLAIAGGATELECVERAFAAMSAPPVRPATVASADVSTLTPPIIRSPVTL